MAIATQELISQIDSMTVLELNTLVKALEEHYGVSAAAAAVAAAPAGGAGGGAAAEAPRADRVRGHPDRRRRQEDQRHQGGARGDQLGLKEAKDLVESPSPRSRKA
jgi:large subunit ribosomal protein L7/L12